MVKGVGGLLPYHFWDMAKTETKIATKTLNAPYRKMRRKRKKKGKKGKGNPETPNPPKGGGKGEESLATVKETSPPSSLENKICGGRRNTPQTIKRCSGAMFSRYYKTGEKTVSTILECRKK